jgi:hypothetical protein
MSTTSRVILELAEKDVLVELTILPPSREIEEEDVAKMKGNMQRRSEKINTESRDLVMCKF